MNKKNVKACLSALLVFFGVCNIFELSGYAEDQMMIRSQYRMDSEGKWKEPVVWIFKGDSGIINVFLDGKNELVATLSYSADGKLKKVEKKLEHFNEKKKKVISQETDSKIFLSDGFPVPYDDLDPKSRTTEEVVNRKSAGGVTFAEKIKKEVTPITIEKAISLMMVDSAVADHIAGKPLYLITIKKKELPLVTQLWVDGSNWWIYEETPIRKSWRMNQIQKRY